MYTIKKFEIKAYPFQDAAGISNLDDLEQWSKENNIISCNSWMMPQLIAHFGQFRVRKNDSGKYDSEALLADNFQKTDLWSIGVWRVINQLKRSSLIKTQISAEYSRYSALVPLVLSGLKQYQNIPYSAWTVEGLDKLVERKLFEAMIYEPPEIDLDELLSIRVQGLTYKSGDKAGSMKSAKSTWKLTGISNTALKDAPELATTMLAQIWVAHPGIRNQYMILDPKNWDNIPDPIINSEVLPSSKPAAKVLELPW